MIRLWNIFAIEGDIVLDKMSVSKLIFKNLYFLLTKPGRPMYRPGAVSTSLTR